MSSGTRTTILSVSAGVSTKSLWPRTSRSTVHAVGSIRSRQTPLSFFTSETCGTGFSRVSRIPDDRDSCCSSSWPGFSWVPFEARRPLKTPDTISTSLTFRSWQSSRSWFPVLPWTPRWSWRTHVPSDAFSSCLPIVPCQTLRSNSSYWPQRSIKPWGPMWPLMSHESHTWQPTVTLHTFCTSGPCESDDANLPRLSYWSRSSR